MAFDKINKVSEQELTPELQEKINSKCSTEIFEQHKNNTTVHITANERDMWNSTYEQAVNYINSAIYNVVGTSLSSDTNIIEIIDGKVSKNDFNSFKDTLHNIAFSGSFNDLKDKPSQVAYSQDANHAYVADAAITAETATKADSATYATNAGNAATVGGVRITISGSAPSDPVAGKELWFDTTEGAIKAYVGTTWIKSKGVWG